MLKATQFFSLTHKRCSATYLLLQWRHLAYSAN